ncbi:MAG: hypothetical protein ABUT39_00480 [Acidobacteriota bacterium]
MLGDLSQRESRRVILHLLPGCARCRTVTAALWNAGSDATNGVGDPEALSKRFRYDSLMNRVINRVRSAQADLEAERAEARHRMAELDARPRELWPALVQAEARFHTWGFCELLLDRARRARDLGRDLGEAGVCAGLTVSLSGRIDTSIHPDALVQELTARAWTALADVWREAGDLKSAEESLRRAEAHLLRGTGDRMERARLLERKAALRTSQGRPEDAARLLSRSILLYRRLGQWDQVGRVLAELGCIEKMRRIGEQAAIRRGLLRLWLDRLRRISARLQLLRD